MLPRSDGMWVHPHRGAPVESLPLDVQSVPAVTAACMLIRRDLFEAVGGFDESLPLTLNDVDLCRRVRDRGKLVVVTPKARLLHYEGLSRGFTVDPAEG
jgi:GT2 family glycosyltransferase